MTSYFAVIVIVLQNVTQNLDEIRRVQDAMVASISSPYLTSCL